ncbi:MAG: hypothetical protein PHR59_08290 [Candidatus Cloacimonetes bacterium]|nr:hypothetical protein [Candidatus Cloacimonadota bacterium]MDD4667964.1 hypothetical protein [Candidatus Cloacimonadota bacterium]
MSTILKNLVQTTCLAIVLGLSLLSCSQEPTKVTVTDANRDLVAHLSPDPDILGNTEIFFIPGTIQGSAIWVINGPGANVGVDIRDKGNSAFIYFADAYIGKSDNVAQTGTQIPWGRWMRVRLVEYKSGLSGYVVNFLSALGLDFFDSLEDYMIEHVYETDVYLEQGGKKHFSTPVIKRRNGVLEF